MRDLSQPGAPVIAEKSPVTAIEPESFGAMYKVEWEHGSAATLASLGQDGAILSKKFASAHHLRVGQRLLVLTASGHQVTLTVRGIIKEEAIGLFSNLTISRTLARTAFGQREDGVDFIAYAPGANGTQVHDSVNALLHASFPQTHAQTAAQYTQEQSNKVNKFLLLVYVLLALSVLVSLFGIVNTLVLSIYERTHELGNDARDRRLAPADPPDDPLRVADHRTDRRRARPGDRCRGAVLVTTFALSGSGYVLSIPIGTLILLLIAAGLAGLLAAQLPARRAARLDVLGALASE